MQTVKGSFIQKYMYKSNADYIKYYWNFKNKNINHAVLFYTGS